MDIRYSANQNDFKHYTTEEIRKEFLIQDLYQADQVVAVYSHVAVSYTHLDVYKRQVWVHSGPVYRSGGACTY